MKQLLNAHVRKNVSKLTSTYITLSLADIAKSARKATAQEAELYVLEMVERGDINARINSRDGMLAFPEDTMVRKLFWLVPCSKTNAVFRLWPRFPLH